MLPKWKAKGVHLYYGAEVMAIFTNEDDAKRAALCLQALDACAHPEEFDYQALKEAFSK